MAEPFTPHKPEEQVVAKITKREVVLLTKLRKYAFGKFVVSKMNGLIVRLEINDSQTIDETGEVPVLE